MVKYKETKGMIKKNTQLIRMGLERNIQGVLVVFLVVYLLS